MNNAKQAMSNIEYLRRLLEQRQPRFAGSLESAASLVEGELHAPLAGLRILEVSAHPGLPLGGLTLAELGAEVIRIDHSASGAGYVPAWTGPENGRRSLTLDFRSAGGRQTVADLLAASGPRGGILLTCTAGQSWLSRAGLSRWRPDLIHLDVRHRLADVDLPLAAGPEQRSPRPDHLLPPWDVAYGLHAAAGLLAAGRHRRHTGRGDAITLTREEVTRAAAGHLAVLAEAQLTKVHRVRIGDRLYGGFARDFATADRQRVIVTIFTRRQFADLAKITRLAGTFTFLERLLHADFSACDDLYTHRESIASLLAPWFDRRTVADLAAASAGTSVPRESLPRCDGRRAIGLAV